MIKNRTVIEVEVKGREFRLECVSDSTWEEVSQALSTLYSFAMERVNAAKAQLEKTNEPVQDHNVETL